MFFFYQCLLHVKQRKFSSFTLPETSSSRFSRRLLAVLSWSTEGQDVMGLVCQVLIPSTASGDSSTSSGAPGVGCPRTTLFGNPGLERGVFSPWENV